MQEEVENRTVNLAISTTKLTGRSIVNGIQSYLRHREKVKSQNGIHKHQGKQSVKQLLGQNQGATNAEIDQEGIKDFKRLANKYGIDYAIRKDKSVVPPRYIVFVRSKDADALDSICKEYEANSLNNEKKPSVLAKLKEFTELVKSIPHKVKERKQERDL